MTIAAQHLHTWIGAEVLDPAGEKLGKLDELHYGAGEPLVAAISSGLAGRKHHLASLRGAAVSRDAMQLGLAAGTLVQAGGHGIGRDELAALAAHDERFGALEPEDLEGWSAREERLAAEAEARAAADELDAEAERRAEEEAQAQARARDAGDEAEDARHAREEAEEHAARARRDAAGR